MDGNNRKTGTFKKDHKKFCSLMLLAYKVRLTSKVDSSYFIDSFGFEDIRSCSLEVVSDADGWKMHL